MSDLPPAPPMSAQPQERFPCEACGAKMRFNPSTNGLICDHCGKQTVLDDPSEGPWGGGQAIRELDLKAALADQLSDADQEETQVFKCTGCGAAVEFEPGIHADACPFCATPIVGGTGPDRHIKPRGVLPFELDENAARAAMTAWLGQLWFAPSGLQEFARKGRKIEGIYMPYWTFDAQSDSVYSGQRGDYYYVEVRTSDDNSRTVRKTRWRPARGRVQRFFDDVLVIASRSLPTKAIAALPPWDLSRMRPYQPDFLAGLRAEAYTVDLDEGFVDARQQMDRTIERDVRFDIGGDRQKVERIDTKLSQMTFKHVLLPVWVAVYRFDGKPYQILINGQSGRVQGERPYSKTKIALAILGGLVLATALAYGVMVAQQNGLL